MGRLLIGLIKTMFVSRLELAGIEFAAPKKYIKEKVYGYVRRRIGPSDWAFLVLAVTFGVVIALEMLNVVSNFASYIATLVGEWTRHMQTPWPLFSKPLHFGAVQFFVWASSVAFRVLGVLMWMFRFVKRLLPFSHPENAGVLVWVFLLCAALLHIGAFAVFG